MTPKTIRTMEEFAQAVGLSRPTVSKYFQDPASVRIKVRERIEEAVAETGFRPNLFAVNLNRRRSKIIGLIFPASLDPFYMGLRGRIEAEATAAGYLPFVFSSEGRADLEAEAIETLSSLNVAGVIMAPVGGDAAHRAKLKALAARIPIIFIDAPFDVAEARLEEIIGCVGCRNNEFRNFCNHCLLFRRSGKSNIFNWFIPCF